VVEFFRTGRTIGRGGYGRVVANDAVCPGVVVKYSRSAVDCRQFEGEYAVVRHITGEMERLGFRDEHAGIVPVLAEFPSVELRAGERWCALVMQRIFRPHLEFGANNTLSYQLYLGSAYSQAPRTIGKRGNYIGPAQVEALLGRAGVEALAVSMARLIAFLHYGAKVDAVDMEYLLGSTVEAPDRVRVVAVDFDRVRRIDPATETVETLEMSLSNEPYFPTYADRRLFALFKAAYLADAAVYGFVGVAQRVMAEYEDTLEAAE
jgi:hypothetical protein